MGIAERKEREKNLRKDTIMKCAKKLILKSGVEGMSMNRLAEITELNKATLYLYFSNKDDLIDAIVLDGLKLLESKYKKAVQRSGSGLEKVLNLIRVTFGFYKEYPLYFYTMNHQERRRMNERLETPYAVKGNEIASRIFEYIAEGLRQGMEEGGIRKEINIDTFLVLLFAQIYGILHTIYSKEDVYKDIFHLDALTIEKSGYEVIAHFLYN